MGKRLPQYLNTFYKKPLLYAITLGIIIFFISVSVISIAFTNYKQQQLNTMQAQLELVKTNINRIVKSTDLELFNLALQINDNGEIENIDSIGKVILARNNFIIGIETVPNGVVRDVYPFERHKGAIGLNILKLNAAAPEALNAIKTKKIFYAGPLDLKQSGKAIIARLPIFKNGEFWGFSAIIIDFEAFLNEIGIYRPIDDNIQLSFSKFNQDSKSFEVWNNIESSYTKKLEFGLLDSNWTVSVYYKFYLLNYLEFIFFGITAFLLTIVSSYLLYHVLKKPAILERNLQKKSNELIVQNNYFSSLINAIPDFIFIVDKEGKMLNFHSSNVEGLLDEPGNFIGKNVADYFNSDLTKKLIGKVNYAIKYEELTSHNYSLDVVGKKEYFEARIVRINQKEALVFVRKITNVVEANSKLTHSESKYRHLVQQAPDFIFQTDSSGKIINVNEAGFKWTFYSEQELIAMPIDQLIKVKNDDKSVFSYLKRKGYEPLSAVILNKDNSQLHVEITATALGDGGLLGIARDLTERNKYIEFIESQNKKLSEITWIQSHEVRAPLTKIMTLVEFMKNNYDQKDFNKFNLIAGMESSLNELDSVIRDIVNKSEMTNNDFWNNNN